MKITKEYDSRVDTKKRVTLRGAKYDYYRIQEFADGRIVLEPRELVPPFEISSRSLSIIDESIKNLRDGKVSDPIDLSSFTNEDQD